MLLFDITYSSIFVPHIRAAEANDHALLPPAPASCRGSAGKASGEQTAEVVAVTPLRRALDCASSSKCWSLPFGADLRYHSQRAMQRPMP